ncbi:MAG: DNA polymerase III subunit beta [Patescibacteria group bacterium]
MNFSCLQENLQKGLQFVSHITGREQSLPILSSILFKTQDGLLTLYATNLEIGASCSIRGKIEKEGSIALPSKIFTEYISLLPKEKIDIELHDNNILHVKCQNYSTKIKGLDPNEFPLIPQLESPQQFEFQTEELKKAFQCTLFTVSPQETKQELSGLLCLFNHEQNTVVCVGTDAYRLAEYTLSPSQEIPLTESVIIPLRTAQEVLRMMQQDTSGKIRMEWNEHQIAFYCDSYQLISKRIQGTYPDYTQIIPQSFATKIVLDVDECSKAVKTTSLFSKSSLSDIHIQCLSTNRDQGRLLFSSSNAATGESVVQLEVEMQGSENAITLNYKYFLDGLQTLESTKGLLSIIDNTNPCILKPIEKPGYQYLIMPIRQ